MDLFVCFWFPSIALFFSNSMLPPVRSVDKCWREKVIKFLVVMCLEVYTHWMCTSVSACIPQQYQLPCTIPKAINESQCSYLLPSNLDCSARRPRQPPPLPVIDCWARHHNGPLTCSTVSDADIKHVLHNGQIGCYDFSWNFRPSKVW